MLLRISFDVIQYARAPTGRLCRNCVISGYLIHTVFPIEYAHGFVVFCYGFVISWLLVDSCDFCKLFNIALVTFIDKFQQWGWNVSLMKWRMVYQCCIKPCGAETGVFHESLVSTMYHGCSKALAPCITRSTAMGKWVPLYHEERFQPPVPSQSQWMLFMFDRNSWTHKGSKHGTEIKKRLIVSWGLNSCEIMAWISKYIRIWLWDVITHPYPSLSNGLSKLVTGTRALSRKARAFPFCIVNIMTTDDLATSGARASETIVLTWFSWHILASAPEELRCLWFQWFCITFCWPWCHVIWRRRSFRKTSRTSSVDSMWEVLGGSNSHIHIG